MSLLFGTGAIASSGLGSKPGMVLIKPTSIAHSGTSASIGANGQVTFTAVTSLSLNGVFSADFDNYVLAIRGTVSASTVTIRARMRASGTDATGTNYTDQGLDVDSTTVTGFRSSSQAQASVGPISATQRTGNFISVYGPFLAQPTAFRTVSASGQNSAQITDYASTHSLSTSYDGITLFPSSNNITGQVSVYGVRS